MFDAPATPPDVDALDRAAVKALVASLYAEIEHLKLIVAKLRRMHFGRKSEKLDRHIEQLELQLEGLQAAAAQPMRPAEKVQPRPAPQQQRKDRALPKHLPREVHNHPPKEKCCPECGGALRKLGEDVSEVLEYIPASFFVIRHVRPKLNCARCSCVVQAPAPPRPVDRGMAGPGLLSHVVTAKYADHLPLYRQSQIYARVGVGLNRSTLAKWVGEASALMEPLVEALRRYVMNTDKLHGDDTPLPVLAPGNGKTKKARFWTYVRDNRPAGDKSPPAVWFTYSRDCKGEHPQRHLVKFRGILQADAFAGFDKLYQSGAIQQAPCMAHIRRKFYDLMEAHQSPIATEAVERIAALYRIEAEIRSRPAEERRQVRQARARPLMEEMHEWLKTSLSQLTPKSETAAAIRYALGLWDALMRYLDDGRIEIDNLIAERALRLVALGRRNYLFVGSDHGGQRAAVLYSLIQTAKMNGLDPEALPAPCARPHRYTSHQPHRGVAAVERRRKADASKPSRRVKQNSADHHDAAVLPLPHIAEFIDEGEITLGQMYPVGCVAIANDGHNTLAMLVRNDGETLAQLLTRLDQAIAKAVDEDIYADEINPRS